jgi:hypothetical protein
MTNRPAVGQCPLFAHSGRRPASLRVRLRPSGRRSNRYDVMFSPLGVPESLKSSEHRFLLVVGHLIKHAHVGLDRLHRLAPILRRAWHG